MTKQARAAILARVLGPKTRCIYSGCKEWAAINMKHCLAHLAFRRACERRKKKGKVVC